MTTLKTLKDIKAEFDRNFRHTDKNEVGYFPANRTEEVKSFYRSHLKELLREVVEEEIQQDEIDDDFIDGRTAMANQKMGQNLARQEQLKKIEKIIK